MPSTVMSLSFGVSPWLLAVSIVAAAVLATWLYRMTVPELPPGKRLFLGGLRFAAIFLICFLLLQPVIRLIERETRPPLVAVLVDDSESLRITAGTDTSAALPQSRIAALLDDLPVAMRDADLRFFTFGSDVSPSPVGAPIADSLRFTADRTNISHALEAVREGLRDENLAAVVLVSDGQYNSGRNPLYTSERYPVPIFTAVVGDTTRHRDVQVRRVTTNDIAYVNTELPVQVGIRTEDLGGRQVTVSLMDAGSVASSQRITLPEGSSEVTVDLSVTPESEGLTRYTVVVSELDDELTHRNNREAVTVRVLDSKRSVLLVAAAPGPDVSAVRQLLEGDQTFEITSLVQKDLRSFYGGSLPASLESFDAVVLVGYPGRVAGEEVMLRLAAATAEGLPLLFMLTTSTDLPRLNQYFSDVLPIVPERIRTSFVEASFVPSESGRRHPILNIPDAEPEAWRSLPPLAYSQTRWAPSPDASVLATATIRGVELTDPLLVIRRRVENRTAALLGAGTWRWRNVPEDLSTVEHLWPSLFSNLLQWLTAREDDRPVRVVPVRDLFSGDDRVELTGQVYDESLNPVADATVEVEIASPDGTVSPYVMSSIGNGRYTLDAGALPEGTYDFEAVASKNNEIVGSDRGSFAVGSLNLEYKETRANAELMRQIAQRSGGEVLEPAAPERIASTLASKANLSAVVVEHETELELRRHHIFLALIILLLSVEWFVRKRSGMV